MKSNKIKYRGGFTLVEILTTVAILAVIAIIGFTYANNYKLTEFNVRRKADMDNLDSTINSYYAVNKNYPDPAGNKQFYDITGVYSHSSSGAYGVSGFVTSEVFGKQFLAVTPMDPLTHNFYAYAKTYGEKPAYQFATAFDEKGTYFAYVKGNYKAEDLAGIIKEYNGPNFVINKSSKYLPYNTYEVKLTGKINSYSGDVSLAVGTVDKDLVEGDVITVGTGGLATIYLSDGSELKLGSTTKKSVLAMSNLKYKKDDNLITQVGLKLTLGEIWVKAPKLEDGSEFTLETSNAAASVRGTVFGMTTDGTIGNESIQLIEGKLQLQTVCLDGLQQYFNISPYGLIGYTGALRQEYTPGAALTNRTILEALPSAPIYVSYKIGNTGLSNGSTGTITPEKINDVLGNQVNINEGYLPVIKNFSKTSTGISMDIDNPGANWVEGYTDNGGFIGKNIAISSGTINLTGATSDYSGELAIRLCRMPDKNGCVVSTDSINSNTSVVYNYNLINQANADTANVLGIKTTSQTDQVPLVPIGENYINYTNSILFGNNDNTSGTINSNILNITSLNAYYFSLNNPDTLVNQTSVIFPTSTTENINGSFPIQNPDLVNGVCTQTVVCSQYKKINISENNIESNVISGVDSPTGSGSPTTSNITSSGVTVINNISDADGVKDIQYYLYGDSDGHNQIATNTSGIFTGLTGLTSYWIKTSAQVKNGETGAWTGQTSGLTSFTTNENPTLCEDGFSNFGTFGCMENGLVAYAPYDSIGDYYLHLQHDGIYGSGENLNHTDNECNTFVNLGTTNPCSKIGTGNFYTINNTYTGISLENGNDSLKYDLSTLNLGSNFTIEMSVRGAALIRTDGPYYLWWMGNNRLYLNNGILHYISSGSTIESTGNIPSLIDNNLFYKVKTKFLPSSGMIVSIGGKNIIDSTDAIFSGSTSNLYIGSSDSNFQWNDIIDYVKIYK